MNEMNKRKFIKKIDIIIIFVLIIICFFIYFKINNNKYKKTLAQISYNGKIIWEIDLKSANDDIFTLKENQNVSFQIKDGMIRFVNTKCPDKLCENVGYIYKPNSVAICMPNKVTLKIVKAKDNEIDIIVN